MRTAIINTMRAQVLRMARVLPVVAMIAVSPNVLASSGGFELEMPNIDTGNKKSLQRGARTFVNYCMGCHTADYHRYSRLASDLDLADQDVVDNLIFTTDKVGEQTKVGSLMFNNMTTDYARNSFGVVPPNLALTARSRGEDWIYTYLKSFYVDPERGVGVNNLVYPGAAMPHVLWELQGWQEAELDDHGNAIGVKQLTEGTLSPKEYNNLIADLTAFLSYLSDPIKETRHRIGTLVLLFLVLLSVVAYFLKKEYWKDVV